MMEDALPSNERRTYTLTDLFAYLWHRRTILLLINSVGIGLALLVTLLTSPKYTATMVVISSSQSQMPTGFSQLANLAGHSGLLPGSNTQPDMFNDFITLFRSQMIARLADEKYHIRQKIFSSNWNSKTKSWDMSPNGAAQYVTAFAHFLMGKQTPTEPTYTATSDWLTKNVSLTVDQDTGQWTVQFDSTNPQFAQWLLGVLYHVTEDYLRANLKSQTQQQVSYLTKRLSQITVEDYRQSLLEILSSQEKSLMMLESDAPVAARIVLPAAVTDQPTGPSTSLNLAIGLIVSFIFSITFVVWLDWRRSIRTALSLSEPAEEELTTRRWLKRGVKSANELIRRQTEEHQVR